MNETIDLSLVYSKTPKGVAEINARSGAIPLQTRRVLIMIDGRRPVAELIAVVRSGEFENIINTLETHAMIEKVDPGSLPPRDYEEEDFADTISLLQENAAALRSMPYVSPAAVAQAAHPVAAPAADAQPAVTAHAEAATIAARAVAAASAPRPAEPATRRPPTLTGAGPASLSGNVNAVRLGTMSGSARVPDPTARPPTLTGQRPAATAARAGAAAAPVHAEPAPATAAAPVAAAPETVTRSLEEGKRYAVSELYSVLGPYGEQPAARIQECTSLEALHDQIKHAGRRIATFRGENAAQQYLRTVGHA